MRREVGGMNGKLHQLTVIFMASAGRLEAAKHIIHLSELKGRLECDRMRNGSEVGKEDGFMKLEMMKVPAFAEYWSYPSSSEQACKDECLKNCSCVAYSYYNEYVLEELFLCRLFIL
ncbi:hypothetical protein OIU85_022974 [Salix viminalis]|uniref:Apple domain-containing protein n=1 Tax=Salix viminalis TaxID=40686 RepID=A0A9Q0Z8E8_SALVM|nr:hypothetical protein OIU85_022974 [Salix viminalis]